MIKINPSIKTFNMNLRKQLKRKKEKVYIIGGGPSIDIASLSKLSDGDILAVNKSIDYFNKVDLFITIDYSFLNSKTDFKKLCQKTGTSVFILNKSNNYILKKSDGYYYDTRFRLKYSYLKEMDHVIESKSIVNSQTGFGLDYSLFVHGENSGFCAIQLAILMGYKEIYLLGIDLKLKGAVSHFHNGYKNNSHFRKNLLKYQKTFDASFRKLPKNIKARLFSCSKNSYLNKYLKYVDISNIISKNETVDIFKKQKQIKKTVKTLPIIETNKNLCTELVTPCTNDHFKDLMVVGYFTLNTPYEKEKEKLIASINKFGLPSYLKGIPNLGDWQKNTRYKAIFLKDILEKFPNKKILYVDVDAEFIKEPLLFKNYSCDIAIRWQDFRWKKNESLSGTIYMESNAKTKILCDKWLKYNNAEYIGSKSPKSFEQVNLGRVMVEMRQTHRLLDKNLPPEYCFVFDHMKKIYPNAKPVIEHYQASRRFRNKLNKK